LRNFHSLLTQDISLFVYSCVMGLGLRNYLIVCMGQYAKEAETSYHCTTTQTRANIFSRP
jgi:hypothetical protein